VSNQPIGAGKKLTVAAVGDLMLGDSPIAAGYGFHSRYPGAAAREALEGLRPVLTGVDVVFGNLEAQLTRRGLGGTRLARNMMRGDPEYAELLRDLGFDVLAVANNHAMQHGPEAFAESVSALRTAGIAVAGLRGTAPWAAEPIYFTAHSGATAGILAYSFRPRQYGTGDPCYATGSESAVLADVTRLRTQVDHVIVSLHWGEEFTSQPSTSEVLFAGQLVAAGTSLLLGHHPHVARPVVVGPQGCIAYSLGNAVSDMVWRDEFRHGLALRCRLGEPAPEVDVLSLVTDRRYRVHVGESFGPAAILGFVSGLKDSDYREAIDESMRRYRRSAFWHMVGNVWRSPPAITTELFAEKARNLWARVVPDRSPQ